MADQTTTNESVTQTQANPDFPVFLIHSNWSLSQLDTFLGDYGDVGFLRIVYGKDRKETDRSIAIFSPSTFDAICKDGYDQHQYGRGLKVSKFTLNNWCYPSDGHSKVLFVSVPKCFAHDDSQVIASVTGKLDHLAEWNIIPQNSWSIKVPLKSRETGGVRNGCFISFKRDVHLDCIAMTRLLLMDTYWPQDIEHEDSERVFFQCAWARDRGDVKTKKPLTNVDHQPAETSTVEKYAKLSQRQTPSHKFQLNKFTDQKVLLKRSRRPNTTFKILLNEFAALMPVDEQPSLTNLNPISEESIVDEQASTKESNPRSKESTVLMPVDEQPSLKTE